MRELFILLRKIRFACIVGYKKKGEWIKKHHIFKECGEHVLFQPRKLPNDPKLIKIHNNVAVAADVMFENHDVIHFVYGGMNEGEFKSHIGCIEIMDNVFIGAGSIIMPNIKIGPNAIVAAGAVVTKDVPPNTIVGGVPARVIGDFWELRKRRLEESKRIYTWDRNARIDTEWELFYEERK